eukprot:1977103-Rhodomonas_salina.3
MSGVSSEMKLDMDLGETARRRPGMLLQCLATLKLLFAHRHWLLAELNLLPCHGFACARTAAKLCRRAAVPVGSHRPFGIERSWLKRTRTCVSSSPAIPRRTLH